MRFFWVSASICIGMCSSAQAGPIWSYYSGGETGYQQLTADRQFEKSVFEVRVGSPLPIQQWEAALWEQKRSGGLRDSAQIEWFNPTSVPFSLTYTASRTVLARIGTTLLSFSEVESDFSDMFIRTRAIGTSFIKLEHLRMVSPAGVELLRLGDLVSYHNDQISMIRVQQSGGGVIVPFTLTGTMTMLWEEGHRPSGSELNFEVRMTDNIATIPTPACAALLVGLGLFRARRRISH